MAELGIWLNWWDGEEENKTLVHSFLLPWLADENKKEVLVSTKSDTLRAINTHCISLNLSSR